MKQKGKRFYTNDDKKNIKGKRFATSFSESQNDFENEEAEFDVDEPINVESDDIVYDVAEKEQVSDESSQAKPEINDAQTPHTLTLREKRKQVKQDKKLREKQAKLEKPAKEPKLAKVKAKKSVEPKPKRRISTKREVLSYEDMPLDDSARSSFNKISNSIKNNRKKIVLSFIILCVLVLAVVCVANRDRLTFSNFKNFIEYGILNKDKEEQFPISTDGDVINNGNFNRIGNNIVYASDTRFVTLNNYGRTIYSYQQTFSSPVLTLACDCDLSLVYDLGGKEFAINTLDSTIYTGEAQDNILVADISKSGVYALVTAKDGYLSKLYVYSKDNKQIFAYSFADYYITSVSLNSKGTTAVLSGISAHDGSQLSSIYLLDFTKEEPLFFEEIQDNVVYYVDHLNDNYSCFIGENAVYTLNARTRELKTTNYDGKTLTAFDVNPDTNTFALSLSRSGDGRMCDIYNFTTTGVMKHAISTDLMITSLSTYKNRVAALSGDSIHLFSKDGTALSEKKAGLDPHAIVLYTPTDACVLGVNEIRRLDL